MNPYDENMLRQEVIYLHYLWHQGPPQNSNPNPNKRPRPFSQNPSKKSKRLAASGSHPPPKPDHGPDWSIFVKPPAPSSSGWPEPKSESDQQTGLISAEEQARYASLQIQKKVLGSCRQFFNRRVLDEENDDDDSEEDEEESEVDNFFMGIFVNNDELRSYYDENHEKGEFFCLVCGGIGENIGKTFTGCIGLVHHCMSISKTKKRTGHRAFGSVVCKVLGWDISRLPMILFKGEPLSHTLANLRQSENNLNGDDSNKIVENLESGNSDVEIKKGASDSLDNGDDLNVILGNMETENADCNESVKSEVSSVDHRNNGELIIREVNNGDDANKGVEGNEISDAEPINKANNNPESESAEIITGEWPCLDSAKESASTTVGWASFEPPTAPITSVVSAEEQVRFNVVQLQQNVFEACKQFLSTTAGSDSDEDDNENDVDEDEDDLMGEDGSEECKEFNFFLRLFTENNELRNYYKTNCRGGDFCCLVCCGIGKKTWRTFKDCLGLLQHSTAISKTKKKRAHRAFGLVICKVLGWDIDHLPSIVIKGKPLTRSLEDLSKYQRDRNTVCDKDDSIAPADKTDSETSKEAIDAQENNNVVMSSENSSMENNTQPKADRENSSVDDLKPGGSSQSEAETS